jgi:hypothetical protein
MDNEHHLAMESKLCREAGSKLDLMTRGAANSWMVIVYSAANPAVYARYDRTKCR